MYDIDQLSDRRVSQGYIPWSPFLSGRIIHLLTMGPLYVRVYQGAVSTRKRKSTGAAVPTGWRTKLCAASRDPGEKRTRCLVKGTNANGPDAQGSVAPNDRKGPGAHGLGVTEHRALRSGSL